MKTKQGTERTTNGMIIMIRVGDQEADCPACGNANAMLFWRDPVESIEHAAYLKCRDCGFKVVEGEASIREFSSYSNANAAIDLGLFDADFYPSVRDLTAGELRVLRALQMSSSGNGDDFGIIEDARIAVREPRQLAGFVANLVKKGFIICAAPERINRQGAPITQFVFKTFGKESKYDAADRIERMIMAYDDETFGRDDC